MVWAAMKSDGAICLRRWPQKMNSAAYQSVLQSAIGFIRPRCVPHWSHHPMGFCVRRGKGWKFQQDGAPPHRSLSTQAFITRKKVIKFNAGFWPPMSPDLNPIEHLWPLVLRQLNGAVFSGKEQLWAALQEAFAAITPAQVAKLYQSLPKRMLAVRAAKGGGHPLLAGPPEVLPPAHRGGSQRRTVLCDVQRSLSLTVLSWQAVLLHARVQFETRHHFLKKIIF